MDSLKQPAKLKISVQCPNGHSMYPNGVIVGNLYKDYGIRLLPNQEVDPGHDWSGANRFMSANGFTRDEKMKARNKNLNYCPTYKLTQTQMNMLGNFKCKDCNPPE